MATRSYVFVGADQETRDRAYRQRRDQPARTLTSSYPRFHLTGSDSWLRLTRGRPKLAARRA